MTKEIDMNIRGLGNYMRKGAQGLHETRPIKAGEAQRFMNCPDIPYAQATLMRLVVRGIAAEVDGGFIRGPRWQACARYYGWLKDATQE